MCGHIAFFDTERMYDRWDVPKPDFPLANNYNVYPGQPAPIILNDGDKRVALKQFGFNVKWSKKPIFNAKSETLAEKSLFSKKLRENRCLIPATSYFEWGGEKGKKKEYEHQVNNGELFALAGLYDDEGFTIITTDAWPKLAKIHHRMPVALQPEYENEWINPDMGDPKQLLELLAPLPAKNITFAPVTK